MTLLSDDTLFNSCYEMHSNGSLMSDLQNGNEKGEGESSFCTSCISLKVPVKGAGNGKGRKGGSKKIYFLHVHLFLRLFISKRHQCGEDQNEAAEGEKKDVRDVRCRHWRRSLPTHHYQYAMKSALRTQICRQKKRKWNDLLCNVLEHLETLLKMWLHVNVNCNEYSCFFFPLTYANL